MIRTKVSSKGQLTLPVAVRRKLGIDRGMELEVIMTGSGVFLEPIKRLTDLSGIFSEYASNVTDDWETARRKTEEAIAREVENDRGF